MKNNTVDKFRLKPWFLQQIEFSLQLESERAKQWKRSWIEVCECAKVWNRRREAPPAHPAVRHGVLQHCSQTRRCEAKRRKMRCVGRARHEERLTMGLAATAEAINRARSKTQTKAAGGVDACEFMNRRRQNARSGSSIQAINQPCAAWAGESESNDVMSGGVGGWLGFDISSLNKCTSAGCVGGLGGWVGGLAGERRVLMVFGFCSAREWRRRGLRPRRELGCVLPPPPGGALISLRIAP